MKTLYQLFYILKIQILIYPSIFMGIMFNCVFPMVISLSFNPPGMLLSFATLFFLSHIFLRQGECYEDQRSASAAWPQPAALLNFFYPMQSGSFFWTRALDRKLIQLSQIVLYAFFVLIMLLPGIALIGKSSEPLQIGFDGPEDNSAFQRALLSDPHLGAYQFNDYGKRIIVEIPHAGDYQIGLWLFQALFLSLFFLWIFKGLNLPERWRYMILVIPIIGMLPLFGWLFLPLYALLLLYLYLVENNIAISRWIIILVLPIIIFIFMLPIVGLLRFFPFDNHFMERYLPTDPSFYGDRFLLYAKYHLWLWIGLALAAIFLIQSIIRKHLRPA
jgi:hypothetical protein